jgi:hypothetical protein
LVEEVALATVTKPREKTTHLVTGFRDRRQRAFLNQQPQQTVG